MKKILISLMTIVICLTSATVITNIKAEEINIVPFGAYIPVSREVDIPGSQNGSKIIFSGSYERVNNVATNIDVTVTTNHPEIVTIQSKAVFQNGNGIKIDVYYYHFDEYKVMTIYA